MTQENSNQNSTDNQGGFNTVHPHKRRDDEFTRINNAVFDHLMHYCTPAAFMIYMVIWRKTEGWHKEWDAISYSQFEELTGLSRPTVWRAIQYLLGEENPQYPSDKKPDYKLISVRGKGKYKEYSLCETLELIVYQPNNINVTKINRLQNVTDIGYKMKPEPVTKCKTQKTNKETKDTGRTGIDSYIEAMLKVYNGVFSKRARRSKAVEQAAADLMLKGITLEDYLEGCKRYQKNGTIDIRGPESIASWAINAKHDRERGVKVSKEPYQDANGNWHRE